MVRGAWGVVSVHPNELSPPHFRAAFPGIACQIGNAISSPVIRIIINLSERRRITYKGKKVEPPRSVIGIATATIAITRYSRLLLVRGIRGVASGLPILPDARTRHPVLDLLGSRHSLGDKDKKTSPKIVGDARSPLKKASISWHISKSWKVRYNHTAPGDRTASWTRAYKHPGDIRL
ncbi:hypothetical protein BDM02DRAFT_2072528 [Thelephora ganbajun]|uniref:Uncharacterized protein n=1 Tax=Thelephora ganbajun TaxID=370292 RepID=A0ACB6ZGQ2_THEGA|nr:hypothetical protein BDM02DRAFT_2072528 [Thelephora ganbajun]